ncbi:restriction endonuclease subunit S [Stutzerimonas xanthomarina]|uniref:restriction endonuclease subunit S n=1 Tax=Stutzerimonas xanthomarina TaxID=271420 RepID=UPI003AA7C54D
MTALLTDNLPLLAGAPNGIKKLRELILELAVRGKLLEQNADDEAASELLKQIAEEKTQLITKGKTREQVSLQEINEAAAPFKAAPGWVWVKLGDISIIERGGSPRPIKDFITEDADGLNWIKIGDTDKGGKYITSAGEKIRREGLVKTRMVYPGDFLLTNSMSFGRPYITQIEGCIHDGWLRISPPTSLVKDYLYLLLSSPYVRSFFVQAAAGAVVLNLNADKVRDLPIPLPPLAEQHRIVAKVDELMALCDRLEAQQADAESAHAQLVQALLDSLTQTSDAADFAANWQRLAEHFHTLFTTEPSIDALKQTLLQLAVMGKLVPQESSDEPASELLKRIAEEKARLVTEDKIKKQKSLPEIGEEEKPFELPTGWCWTRLGAIGASATGKTPSTNNSAFFGGDLPFIGPGQITVAGQIGESEKWLTDLAREETSVVEAGDILMVCIGGSIGKCAIADREMAFNQQINSIRVVLADNQYTFCTMTTPAFRASVWASATGTATPIINRSKWDELLIPIPPLAEQYRIVAKVDQLKALCDQLKNRLTQARQLNEQLASTLVEQAVA